MNIIKVLLKNSLRIFWKFKYFMLQFCLLLLIAITILSSVFLSITSLKTSYDKVIDQGVNPQASILYEEEDKDKINFKINNKDFEIGANNNLSLNWSDIKLNPIMIYNPLVENIFNYIDNQNVSKSIITYGFFKEFKNPKNAPQKAWPNLIYSENYEFANSVNTLITPETFRNSLSDVFSFYENVVPFIVDVNSQNNFYNLYDLNNYSINPWSLKLDTTNNNLSISDYGVATIDGFSNKDYFYLKHGIFDKEVGSIVNSDTSIFNINSTILNERWKQITLNKTFYGNFQNLSLNLISCNQIPTIQEFRIFYDKINSILTNDENLLKSFSQEYLDFLNATINLLKTNFFIKSIGQFEIHYKVNPFTSNTVVKFITDKYNTQKNLFNQQDAKYFEGTIKIPVIPFLTIKPKQGFIPSKQDLTDSLSWTNNKWEINNNSIDYLITNTLISLQKNINEMCKNKLIEFSKSNIDIYNEYLQNYDIFNVIEKNDFLYSTTSYFDMKDNEQSFIISENNPNSKLNKIVVDKGIELLEPDTINFNNYNNIGSILNFLIKKLKDPNCFLTSDDLLNPAKFTSDILNIFSVIKNADFKASDQIKNLLNSLSTYLSNPINATEKNINKYNVVLKKFLNKFNIVDLSKTNYGFFITIAEIVSGMEGVVIDFIGNYYSRSASIILMSRNWTEFLNNKKSIIDEEFLKKALLLPNNHMRLTQDEIFNEINKNPAKYINNFIFNPYSNKEEFYLNFNDWIRRIPEQFKVKINNDEYVISGSGISPEFIYPIKSENQLLLENSVPVVFCNSAGFAKIYGNSSNKITKNIWVASKKYSSLNPNFKKSFNTLNKDITNISNQFVAYETTDENQPTKLTYLRINFSKNILNILTIFLVGIGLIIGFLSFFFVATLLRSIIKQNINTLAICLSNGVNKFKLVVSLTPIVLIPSFISTIIGYGISLVLYSIFNSIIVNYWALNIETIYFSALYFFVILLISSIILSLLLVCIVYWTLRKETSQLLVSRVEFRMNKLIVLLSPVLSKLNSLLSFRLSYILGNITRLMVLLILSTTFVTICTTFVSSNSTFNDAISQTNKNKNYSYAVDLFSPTKSGGYYSNINYDYFGTTQQGFISLYDLNDNSPSAIYGSKFKDALTYDPTPNDPNNNDELVYTNLALPNVSYVKDIQNNVFFFKNQFWSRLILDYEINFLDNKINPWLWAQKVIPSSITNIADNLFNNQINDAISYFYYLFSSNNNSNDKYLWYYNYYDIINNTDPNFKKPNLLDDLRNKNNEISKDPKDWNQDKWTYNYVYNNYTQKYEWKLNEKNISLGLPTFELKPSVVKLATYIISFTQNSDYIAWKQLNNELVENKNFFLALNAVPFDNQTETYSYINGSVDNIQNNEKVRDINIKGIKPTSNYVFLYDNYNNDLDLKIKLEEYEKNNTKSILTNYPDGTVISNLEPIAYDDNSYPIIINEVVSKKYGLKIDDILTVSVNNTFDRFEDKFLNIIPKKINFKVIGITTSKSEEQYYTTQTVANYLLHYKKPIYANKVLQKGNYDNVWTNLQDVKEYIPFNGIFTKNTKPLFFTNDAVIYSQSGLSPLSSGVPTDALSSEISHDTIEQIRKSWPILNNVLKVDIVNSNSNPSQIDILQFSKKFEELYGTQYYLNLALNNIDLKQAGEFLGTIMDKTVADIYQIILISFIPTLIIILFLISYIVVIESRRLISLLKVLGFNDFTNTITLTLIYFIVLCLSMLIATGLTYLIAFIFRTLIFEYISIIINPVATWWIYLATFGSLFLINCSLSWMTYYKLSHTNTAFEISYR